MAPATVAIETGQRTLEAMQTWPHWKEIARGAQKEESLGEICKEPPASCTDPFPAPPDPSPVPDEDRSLSVRQSILNGSPRFVQAYTSTFGYPPSLEFWPRAAFIDAIAQ